MQRGIWDLRSGASGRELQELQQGTSIELPAEYLAFLHESNGGGGEIPVQPWGIFFWKASEVNEMNAAFEVALNVPGFYAFGTSGGGEMFAFDSRGDMPWRIVIVPFIGMAVDEAIEVAPDFASFRKMFGFADDKRADEASIYDAR